MSYNQSGNRAEHFRSEHNRRSMRFRRHHQYPRQVEFPEGHERLLESGHTRTMPAKGVIAESSDGQVGILGRVKL